MGVWDFYRDAIEVQRAKAQYDNGVAAGAPPDFDGTAYGVKPLPAGESAPGGVTLLPRLGGSPVLIDAAPQGGPGITPYAPKVPETAAPMPVAVPVAPGATLPILRAAPGQPTTTAPAPAQVERVAFDWRLAFLATAALFVFFALTREDK